MESYRQQGLPCSRITRRPSRRRPTRAASLYARTLAFILTAAGLTTAAAQTPESYAYNVDECVAYALRHRAAVLNARLDVAGAQEENRIQISQGLPQVAASFNLQDFLVIPTTVIPASAFVPGAPDDQFIDVQFGTQYNSTAGIQATQLAFDGVYFIGLKAAREYVELTRLQAMATEVEVAAAVSKAYYAALVSEVRMDLLNTSLTRVEKQLNDARASLEAGAVEKLDVTRAEVAYNNLKTERQKAQRLVELSYNLLKFQMGMPAAANLRLTQRLSPADFTPSVIDTTIPFAPERRIEFQTAMQGISLQDLNIRRFKAGYWPTVNLSAGLSTQAFRTEFDLWDTQKRWFPTSVIGLNINWNIFAGFRRDAQVQKAKIDQEKNVNLLEEFETLSGLEYDNARKQFANALQTLDAQRRTVELAEEVYRVAKIKYDEGVGASLEVTLAENDFKDAQTNYANAMLEAYMARIDLEKALGTIQPPTVEGR